MLNLLMIYGVTVSLTCFLAWFKKDLELEIFLPILPHTQATFNSCLRPINRMT